MYVMFPLKLSYREGITFQLHHFQTKFRLGCSVRNSPINDSVPIIVIYNYIAFNVTEAGILSQADRKPFADILIIVAYKTTAINKQNI